jgi:hypothetical protein
MGMSLKNLTERRMEILKMQGMGFNDHEITKELSQKYNVSRRAVQRDIQVQAEWSLVLSKTDRKRLFAKYVAMYEQNYRNMAVIKVTTENESNRIGASKLQVEILDRLCQLYGLNNLSDVLTLDEAGKQEHTRRIWMLLTPEQKLKVAEAQEILQAARAQLDKTESVERLH